MSSRLSPDGLYYWDGRSWVSTLSPDGRYRWDGNGWVPASGMSYTPAGVGRTLREPTSWTRPLQAAVAAWFVYGLLVGVTAPLWMSGFMTQIVNQSIQRQQQLNPQATPVPAGFVDSMTAMMTGVAWFAAVFAVVLYGAGLFGVLKRWTWLYYVVLAWLGLGLLSLPLNLVNALSGHMMSGTTTLNVPAWFLYQGLASSLLGGALFVWMLIAMIRYGPWAMRRVAQT